MKKILFIIIIVIFSNIKCANFNYQNLHPEIKFSIPYSTNSEKDKLKIIKNSDYFYQIPDNIFVKEDYLFLVDKYNNRLLIIDENNKINREIHLMFNENKIVHLFIDTNQNKLYLSGSEIAMVKDNIFPGRVKVNKKNEIFLENILLENNEEGNDISNYSIVLRYNNKGKLKDFFSLNSNKNKIFPFEDLEYFDFDSNDNIFFILKKDLNWRVLKYDVSAKNILEFNINKFLSKLSKDKDENFIIDNIDFMSDGNNIIIAVSVFEKEVIYRRTIFYKLNINGSQEKLFTLKDKRFNFVLVNYNNLIYLETTLTDKDNIEKILFRIVNLQGKTVINKLVKLNRKKEKWFNMYAQKDDKIIGINLSDNKYNVVLWK